jgi:hypothetical protein
MLCTCEADGEEPSCTDWGNACVDLNVESISLIEQARECDPLSNEDQCNVLVSYVEPYCGSCTRYFNEANVPALVDGVAELSALSQELDCDAPIDFFGECGGGCIPPASSRCSSEGRCVDSWLGIDQLDNGGFDTLDAQDFPWNWSVSPDGPFTADVDARTGEYSMRLELSASGIEYRLEQTVGHQYLRTGAEMELTGYYRASRVDSELAISLRVGAATYSIEPPASADEWLEFTVTFVAPSNLQVTPELTATLLDNQNTTLWFDDLRLEQLSSY